MDMPKDGFRCRIVEEKVLPVKGQMVHGRKGRDECLPTRKPLGLEELPFFSPCPFPDFTDDGLLRCRVLFLNPPIGSVGVG